MIESARFAVQWQYCLPENRYAIPTSHYSPPTPDIKSFMTCQDTILFHSVSHTALSRAGPRCFSAGGEQRDSLASHALSLPRAKILYTECFVQHFVVVIFLNVHIYKFRQSKSMKKILYLEWKVLSLALSSLENLFQPKSGHWLPSLAQPHAKWGCQMYSHSCPLL